MNVWSSITRLILGSDEDEKRVMEGIRERKTAARYAAAARLERQGRDNLEHAALGLDGAELRAQGRQQILQARRLRNGEISLLAAMNLDGDEDDAMKKVIERAVGTDEDVPRDSR